VARRACLEHARHEAVGPDRAVRVQWKIYPCEIVPWTVIERWHNDGKHAPYDDAALEEVLVAAKARVKPWVRLNRVRRDIPLQYVLAGMENGNLRQVGFCRISILQHNPVTPYFQTDSWCGSNARIRTYHRTCWPRWRSAGWPATASAAARSRTSQWPPRSSRCWSGGTRLRAVRSASSPSSGVTLPYVYYSMTLPYVYGV
jgi:hypothetical protein